MKFHVHISIKIYKMGILIILFPLVYKYPKEQWDAKPYKGDYCS